MNNHSEFSVIRLSSEPTLIGFDISRKIFCLPDDVDYFKAMLKPGSDIQIVIHHWMLPKCVAIAGDCELKIDSYQFVFGPDDFINNEITINFKYLIV